MYDVMVVGAGPVGSYLAYRLASLGYKVMVFERRAKAGEAVCCTGIIGKECFDQFPIAAGAVSTQASSAKFFSPSGKYLRLCKETVQAYVIDRPVFDRTLAWQAQEAGADYLFSARVDDVALVDHRVRVEVEQKGKSSDFDGKVVIISSGFGFSLPRRLGLGKVGDFVLGAQAEVEIRGVDEVEVYFGQEIAPGFFAWLVPTSKDRGLVGLLSRRRPGFYLRSLLLRLHTQGKIASDEVKITYGGIPLAPLTRSYRERVVAVGDAAGQVKPTSCGGIYYGLLCADIAADTTHEALCADDFSAKRLSRYEKAWRKKLSSELKIGYWARRLYERLDDRQIEHIFDVIQTNDIHETLLQSPDFSFDWHSASILGALRHGPLRGAVWSMAKSLLPF